MFGVAVAAVCVLTRFVASFCVRCWCYRWVWLLLFDYVRLLIRFWSGCGVFVCSGDCPVGCMFVCFCAFHVLLAMIGALRFDIA